MISDVSVSLNNLFNHLNRSLRGDHPWALCGIGELNDYNFTNGVQRERLSTLTGRVAPSDNGDIGQSNPGRSEH